MIIIIIITTIRDNNNDDDNISDKHDIKNINDMKTASITSPTQITIPRVPFPRKIKSKHKKIHMIKKSTTFTFGKVEEKDCVNLLFLFDKRLNFLKAKSCLLKSLFSVYLSKFCQETQKMG